MSETQLEKKPTLIFGSKEVIYISLVNELRAQNWTKSRFEKEAPNLYNKYRSLITVVNSRMKKDFLISEEAVVELAKLVNKQIGYTISDIQE